MNAATACRTAVQGGRRLLLITGDAPIGADHRFDYKYIDQAPISGALGLGYRRPADAEEALGALAEAVASANDGRPVVLAVGTDLFGAEVAAPTRPSSPTPHVPSPRDVPSPEPPSPAQLDTVIELLSASRRPLVLAGRGAVAAGAAPALSELARRTGALLGNDAARQRPVPGRAA